MRRILVIDDLRRFRQKPENAELTYARTSKEGLEVLARKEHWDEIWLDHDLGDMGGFIDSIMSVVDYMSERAFNDEPVDVDLVLVHTSNPPGRKVIMTALERYGYVVKSAIAELHFVV